MNSNQSELGLIKTEFSIRINQNYSDLGFMRIDSDWKLGFDQLRFEIRFGLARIHSDCCLGLNRIMSDRFFTVFHQTRYKTFFGLAWNEFLSDTFTFVIIPKEYIYVKLIRSDKKIFHGKLLVTLKILINSFWKLLIHLFLLK